MNEPAIKRALLSVSNKNDLIPFSQCLIKNHIEILATGGTANLLQKHGIPHIPISDYTGFPEILGGRVKTLHPKIYAGILRRPGIDEPTLTSHQIETIDLIVVNLYPFQETINNPDCTFDQAIEQIDIGGPTMLRAAAKNHKLVTVIVDPKDYGLVAEAIQKKGHTSDELRRQLAVKAFAHTALYDQIIFNYLNQQSLVDNDSLFPNHYQPFFEKKETLRYGENPHQAAALYTEMPPRENSLAHAQLLQGKPLSYNNLLDSDAALGCVRALNPDKPGCAIIKHGTPCGVAQAEDLAQAYQLALNADPSSAFGGIIATNQPIDKETATLMVNQQFLEVILAPAVSEESRQLLSRKPAWRVLACGPAPKLSLQLMLRSINGGLLIQQEDWDTLDKNKLKVPTKRQPSAQEWQDLYFAWQIVQYVKSNAIVYAKNLTTIGIGGGQTSRVFSAEIAALKAHQLNLSLEDAVAASDAFIPFADGLEVMAKSGIRAIIQPGGSKRDEEVIAAADYYQIAMVFTGIRHFRH